jgi:peptide/nickel transport system permease protein
MTDGSTVLTKPAAPEPGSDGLSGDGMTRVHEIRRGLRRFMKNRLALIGLIFTLGMVLLAVFAPVISPYPEDAGLKVHFDKQLMPPDRDHWFGTDEVGRDVLSRLLFGARISLLLCVIVLGIAFAIGVPLGLCAGYFEGAVGQVIMRITDVVSSIPFLVLALAVSAALSPSLQNSMLAIAFIWWRSFCRLAYGETLSLKQEDFVMASRSIGASHRHIMFREILPNMSSTLLVKITLDAGYAILVGTAVSFLGAGASPPTPEWGIMVASGRHYLPDSWWVSLFPGLAIFFTVLSFNLLGDGLRDFFHVEVE